MVCSCILLDRVRMLNRELFVKWEENCRAFCYTWFRKNLCKELSGILRHNIYLQPVLCLNFEQFRHKGISWLFGVPVETVEDQHGKPRYMMKRWCTTLLWVQNQLGVKIEHHLCQVTRGRGSAAVKVNLQARPPLGKSWPCRVKSHERTRMWKPVSLAQLTRVCPQNRKATPAVTCCI